MSRRNRPRKLGTVENHLNKLRAIGNRHGHHCITHPEADVTMASSLDAAQDVDENLRRCLWQMKQRGEVALDAFIQAQITAMYWARDGFPVFRITAGLAAALSLTECSGGIDDCKFPFPSFMISIAGESPIISNGGGGITHITASKSDWEDDEGDKHRSLYAIGVSPDMPINRQDWSSVELYQDDTCEGIVKKMDDQDMNNLRTVYRLIFNLAAYINTPSGKASQTTSRPTKGNLKNTRVTSLGKDVKISSSLQSAARGACTPGNSYKLKTRHVRRGHFRQQPHGPKDNQQYKRIWIAPQWIGPDIGEVIERGYQVS